MVTAPKHARELELVSRALAQFPTVRLALVFGSVARSTARDDSDLDVAVAGTGIDVLDIAAALSLAVGRDVHVVRLDDASIPLLEEIIDHGVVVHEGRPGSGASWRSHALADLELDRPWYALQRDAWLKRVAAEGI
jgi:predicted nucleotidyltransferase